MAKRITLPILASSYDKSKLQDASRVKLQNMYLEEVPNFSGDKIVCALPTPGYQEWLNLGGSTVRGMLVHKNYLYVVVDATVYKISEDLVSTSIGTIGTSVGRVSIAANKDELCFADGDKVYSYIVSSGNWAEITDGDLPADVQTVLALGGYFLFVQPDTHTVYVSALNDARTISATSYFSAEFHPDNIIGGATIDNLVYLFGEFTTEIFFISGGQTVPFDRYASGAIQYGCLGAFTPKIIQGNVYWLGKTSEGIIGVVESRGAETRIISNRDFIEKVNEYDNINDVFAWTDLHNGHTFYNLTFPTAEAYSRGRTWSYDITTGIWFERTSFNADGPLFPTLDRHMANCSATFKNKQLIGGFNYGIIYEQGVGFYDENGTEIRREIVTPHYVFDDNFISVYNLELDLEGGQGLNGSGQGSDPEIIMQYSKDRGRTWSNEITRKAGRIGEYKRKVRWGSCGGGYSITFKFKMTDPINWAIVRASCQLEITGGT